MCKPTLNTGISSRRATLSGVLLASCVALSACVTDTAMTAPSPNIFFASLGQDDLTGSYDPAGYATADVQTSLAQVCGNRKITEYSEQAAGSRMVFSAHCWGGTDIRSGTIRFLRFGNSVRIEVPGYIERHRWGERSWTFSL